MQTAIEGFKKTRIFPFNREYFSDYMFAPLQTTDRPIDHSRPSTSRDYSAQTSSFSCTPTKLMPIPQEENREEKTRAEEGAKMFNIFSPGFF